MVGRGVFVDLGAGAFLGTDATGEVAEVVGGQRDIGVERLAHRLAVVPGLGDGEHLQVLLDAVGDLQQDQRTRLDAGLAPGIGGGMGGVQGLLDVGGVGARELGDGLTVDRGKVGEILTTGRLDELAVDVIAVAGFEGNDSAFAAGMGVTHDESPVL